MVKEIVLIGRSNVGKSTLFRQLTGQKVRTGRRPGVTLKPSKYQVGNVIYVDMPGYGFMKNVPKRYQEDVKDFIVHYFEDNRDDIVLALQIIDASAFLDIVKRWEKRGEIPLDMELYDFLLELDLDVALVLNKMDKVKDLDYTLDQIAEHMGMLPPWGQWIDRLAPICAKKGDIEPLLKIIRSHVQFLPH